ncbi:ER-Golgi vesicle protein transport Sft2 [Mycena venus]|uniref:ER-Golgi vesicle protein transport Sft2 n=1 Tax=Mycena venus TaxID=2733690 RepID=A0A8H7DGM7_9AGAR|nr:ER-Golgi vesicle protein transport Sft2 [Mycena venus]
MATPAIIAAGHIHLILSHSTDDFYLEIPIAVVQSNSVRPIKYLRFLGWCIIGILGTVKSDREGVDIVDPALLQDRGTYFYVYDAPNDDAALRYAVDPDVIKACSHISASDSSIRARDAAFKDSLVQRDASCVFTSKPPLFCEGAHIIPFHKGDEWFDLIVKNRPAADKNKSTLTTVVVLKTPNLDLGVDDIPPRHNRALDDDVKYPDGQRYTLQWLLGSAKEQAVVPNNSDATFRKYTRIPKPSPMLLHYNYGAAAVKWWGHGANSHLGISNRPTMPRPSVPVPAATGPTRTKRTAAQLDASILKRATGDSGGSGSGPRENEAARDEEVMDPDEIVMFFWSQNPAALERRKREAEDRKREEEERVSRMEQWRESVIAV